MEVVAKNIRQFLDNNRIVLDDIAVETGLEKEGIQAFMEFRSEFTTENKRDFYRWYLAKILRPPNENCKSFTNLSFLNETARLLCDISKICTTED